MMNGVHQVDQNQYICNPKQQNKQDDQHIGKMSPKKSTVAGFLQPVSGLLLPVFVFVVSVKQHVVQVLVP